MEMLSMVVNNLKFIQVYIKYRSTDGQTDPKYRKALPLEMRKLEFSFKFRVNDTSA